MGMKIKEPQKLKPYMLVEVEVPDAYCQGGKRTFIAEVISFPIPQGVFSPTIMIRRVPGCPGTLEEVNVSMLTHPLRKYKYVHYAVVSGHGSFPNDMLRYDTCVPVNFSLEYRGRTHGQEVVRIDNDGLLVANVETSMMYPHWTPERWISFGWQCKHIRTERIVVGS